MDDAALPTLPFGYTPVWAEKDKYNVKQTSGDGHDPVRIALIGLGGVALGKHLPAIRRLQETGVGIEIVAGCDIDKNLQAKAQHLHGFPCYGEFREMIDAHEIDGVEILTDPGENRLRALEEAVECGVHLLVEKPFLFLGVDRLDETIERAHDIVANAARKKLVVMTGFVKHFSPPYQVAQKLVESGAVGSISLIAIKMCQGWSRHILLEGQACHVLNLALWIGGPIKGLHALGINRFEEPDYPYDNVVVNVEFGSGAIGVFYFNSSGLSLKPWERLEIFGERKWLVVEDGASVAFHDSEEGPTKVWSPVMPHTLFFDEEFSGFAGEVRNFVDAVRGHAPVAVSGEDGIQALVLANMIHTSIAEQRFVVWPETS